MRALMRSARRLRRRSSSFLRSIFLWAMIVLLKVKNVICGSLQPIPPFVQYKHTEGKTARLREGEGRHEETRPQAYSEPPLKKKGPRKKGPPPAYSLLSSAPRLGNEKSLSGERPFHDSVSSGYFQPPPSARQTLTMDDRRSLRAAASCISLSNNERSASSTSRYEE